MKDETVLGPKYFWSKINVFKTEQSEVTDVLSVGVVFGECSGQI